MGEYIVDLELAKSEKRVLKAKDIIIKFSRALRDHLAEKGFDPNLGARPLKRVIQKMILNPLSLQIITSQIKPGDRLTVDLQKGNVVFATPRTFVLSKPEPVLAK